LEPESNLIHYHLNIDWCTNHNSPFHSEHCDYALWKGYDMEQIKAPPDQADQTNACSKSKSTVIINPHPNEPDHEHAIETDEHEPSIL
jgi:hypothetical protein